MYARRKFSLAGAELFRIALFTEVVATDCYIATSRGPEGSLTPVTALPAAFLVRRRGEACYELLLLNTLCDRAYWLQDVPTVDEALVCLQSKMLQSLLLNCDDKLHEIAALQAWGVRSAPGPGKELLPQIQHLQNWLELIVPESSS